MSPKTSEKYTHSHVHFNCFSLSSCVCTPHKHTHSLVTSQPIHSLIYLPITFPYSPTNMILFLIQTQTKRKPTCLVSPSTLPAYLPNPIVLHPLLPLSSKLIPFPFLLLLLFFFFHFSPYMTFTYKL